MADDVDKLLNVPFRFKRRPPPLPGDLRPDWRIATLVLLLEKCHGRSATMRQLHVLTWATRSPQNRAAFLKAYNGEPDLEYPIVRIEPTLNRAIDFASGEGLVQRTRDRIALTERGAAFAKELGEAEGLLVEEKAFLGAIKGKISQKTIERVLEWNDLR